MARVRRQDLPTPVFDHLLDRIQTREIDASQLGLLADWLDTGPEVPDGRWFKRFRGMTVCGSGDLILTFLLPDQTPLGTEVG
jgi:hypothetical protein